MNMTDEKTLQALRSSRLIYGCMNLGGKWNGEPVTRQHRLEAYRALDTALEEGFEFFDHADVYMLGKSESVFGDYLSEHPGLREKIIVQSKAGIRFPGEPDAEATGRCDFSRQHLLSSVEESLKRLKIDYLDVLLLHRPDMLVEGEVVAEVFDKLHRSGKVRFFGVSNHTPLQTEYLRSSLNLPLVANQLQFSLLSTGLLDSGINTPAAFGAYSGFQGGIEHARIRNMKIQAYSPLEKGLLDNRKPRSREAVPKHLPKLQECLGQMAKLRGCSPGEIALAWILRHPANIQPIIGSVQPCRIRAAAASLGVELSREEWYRLFIAGRGEHLP